jgi:hypothetical protein
MANLKARAEKVVNSAMSLLHAMPKSYFDVKTKSEKRRLITLDHFPKPNANKIKDLLGLKTMSIKAIHDYVRSAIDLERLATNIDLGQNEKPKQRLADLTEDLDFYLGRKSPTVPVVNSSKPEKRLEDRSTRELKKLLTHRGPNERDCDRNLEVKNILKTREHVNSSAQSKLIRKMSIHSGKKLTLKEAQLLSNRLKDKKD